MNPYVEDTRIQYLGIHHLGRPHSLRKLRVQLKINNIIELRNKRLIVGWYELNCKTLYCIIDPLHLSNLVFANTSTVNISLDDLEFSGDYGIHLTKEKNGQYLLFLKEDLFVGFINEFYQKTQNLFDVSDWSKFLVEFYARITKSEAFHSFTLPDTFELNPENAKLIESNILDCIHWNGTRFDYGFRGIKSMVVTKDLSAYLCYNHSVDISINNLCVSGELFRGIEQLFNNEITPFLLFEQNYLTVRSKINVFEEFVADFLKVCPHKASTPTEIDQFLWSKIPGAKERFSTWKTNRFKQRLILGNKNDESFYFDSYDKTVNDLVFQYSSYREFILNNMSIDQNIYDLYLLQKNVDPNVEISKLFNTISIVAKSQGLVMKNGLITEDESDDWRRAYIGKKLMKILNGESSFIVFTKEEEISYKLTDHYAYRYLKDSFITRKEGEQFVIEVNFMFIDDVEFEGWMIRSFDYSYGLFPIIFQKEVLAVDRNFFFIASECYYWITFNRNFVRLNMSNLFKS